MKMHFSQDQHEGQGWLKSLFQNRPCPTCDKNSIPKRPILRTAFTHTWPPCLSSASLPCFGVAESLVGALGHLEKNVLGINQCISPLILRYSVLENLKLQSPRVEVIWRLMNPHWCTITHLKSVNSDGLYFFTSTQPFPSPKWLENKTKQKLTVAKNSFALTQNWQYLLIFCQILPKVR